MLLAIDSGNTNVVFGVFDGTDFVKAFRCANDPKRTADEYIVWLSELMKLNGLDHTKITGTVIGSVVPETEFNLVSLCRRYFDGEPIVIGDPGVELGIQVLIDRPEQAGADRLVNAAAVVGLHGGGPAVVVDFGTSTNFDVVSADNEYIGGAIAPGINLAHDALVNRAAKLHKVDIQPPPDAIGRNTIHAMQSGIFYGYVGLVDGILSRIVASLDHDDTKVIATGGLSSLFNQYVDRIDTIAPHLTLDGLRYIYELNNGGAK